MFANSHKNIIYSFLIEPRFRIGRYLLFIIAFTFVAIGQSIFVFEDYLDILGNKIYWFVVCNIIIILLVAYFNLYTIVPRLLLKNRYIEYVALLIMCCIFYLILKGTAEYYILLRLGVKRAINGVTFFDGLSNMVLYAICIASSSVSILLKQWITDVEKINDLKDIRLKSSVDKLKNQINPKSLFNVLDHISERVKKDSTEASDILFILSDVLRYGLYDCKREKVLLESDIEFINNYLRLEQLNSGNRFTYAISVKGEANLFVVPYSFSPVIQRIIEQYPTDIRIVFDVVNNAVKFGCHVSGTDLTKCDFTQEEQQLVTFYGRDIKIGIDVKSIELNIVIC